MTTNAKTQLYNSIVSNPENRGGRPRIDGTNIHPDTIYSQYQAGDSIAFISYLFDITEENVKDAIKYSSSKNKMMKKLILKIKDWHFGNAAITLFQFSDRHRFFIRNYWSGHFNERCLIKVEMVSQSRDLTVYQLGLFNWVLCFAVSKKDENHG